MVIWYDIFVKINVQSFGKNLFVNVVTGIEKKQQYVYKKTEKHVFFLNNFLSFSFPPNVLEWEELENKYQ